MSDFTTPTSDRPSTQELQTVPLTDDPVKTVKQINFYYKICWLGMTIGFPSLFLIPVGFIGLVTAWAILFGLYYGFHLLYLLWTLIPVSIARTTPGEAVGYSFIPGFTCYWAFITYKGLADDMNKTLEQHGLQYRVKDGLGTTFWICVILFHTPLGIVAAPVAVIVWVLFLKSAKNGALALLEHETQ
jgi:hypothetical protein